MAKTGDMITASEPGIMELCGRGPGFVHKAVWLLATILLALWIAGPLAMAKAVYPEFTSNVND